MNEKLILNSGLGYLSYLNEFHLNLILKYSRHLPSQKSFSKRFLEYLICTLIVINVLGLKNEIYLVSLVLFVFFLILFEIIKSLSVDDVSF